MRWNISNQINLVKKGFMKIPRGVAGSRSRNVGIPGRKRRARTRLRGAGVSSSDISVCRFGLGSHNNNKIPE